MTTVDPDIRFRAAVDALVGPGCHRLGLAVSGGPDSLALLLLAHKAFPGRIAAATVDHRLRPESADETAYVARICTGLSVPHAILTPPKPITGNLQAAARKARYALLEDWRGTENIDWTATAHHADDQLETIFMRLLRGSGVDGLAAIRPVNRRVIRPLLGFRKAELAAIVGDAELDPVDDPANRDPRFDRARIRNALAGLDFDPAGPARSAAALADASEALAILTQRAAEAAIRIEDDELILDPASQPREIRRRLLLDCLVRLDPAAAPRGPAVDALLAALEAGETRTLGAVLCRGGPVWRLRLAPPRKSG